MPRNISNEIAGMTKEEIWQYLYGTTAVGNLPQDKKSQDEGHCFHPCPYSLQCDETRARLLLGLSDAEPLPTRTNHVDVNGRYYYMKTEGRIGVWGFECTFENCSYLVANGKPYFRV